MAKVTLKNLSHSYLKKQEKDSDFVITNINIDWNDGGAYALLGPSGCGKTTTMNIIGGIEDISAQIDLQTLKEPRNIKIRNGCKDLPGTLGALR